MSDKKNAIQGLLNVLNRPGLQAGSLSMALDYQQQNRQRRRETAEEKQSRDEKYYRETELLEKIEEALKPPLKMDLLQGKLNEYFKRFPPKILITPKQEFKFDWGSALIKELVVAIPYLATASIRHCAREECEKLFTGGGNKQKHCSATCRKKTYHRPYDPGRSEYHKLYQNLVVRGGLPLEIFKEEWGKLKQSKTNGGEHGKVKRQG